MATAASLLPIGLRWLDDPTLAEPVETASIHIAETRFDPSAVVVLSGTPVTWTFDDDDREHNVVFDDGPGSPMQSAGAWTRTFDRPGEYRYSCTLHAFMDARVVVRRS